MSIILATATFTADDVQGELCAQYGWVDGTAEVTFERKTHRVNVRRVNDTEWVVFSLGARYATGTKVWPACVRFDFAKNKVSVSTGFDNRSGKFSQPRLCCFLADVGTNVVSQR